MIGRETEFQKVFSNVFYSTMMVGLV